MKYGLGDNKWLSVYLNHHFLARMRSTQRSESMHKKGRRAPPAAVCTKSTASLAKRERESNAAYFNTVIPCATKFLIEAQFQHVYTHKKFKEVQAQFREKVNHITRSTHSALGYTVCEVVEQVSNSTFNKFAITYERVSAEELTAILQCAYDNAMVEMQEYKTKSKGKCSLSHEDASLEDTNELQSPPRVRT
ncbi:hypothetical protein Ahy_B08g091370 [Arachis hypogaea]|uniref:Protein FAR1-RELATED SEQUENCE n=1 Tax=Arachis hypogaea TaxID=3818 RepID=A0A444Y214_ARAHY|nr:hypothetical protein Ahy_B08g091370 [Arachis hypogaea]